MYCVKKVKEDLFWVGGTDRRLALFENAYPIPRGVSYNAYVLLDEKTVLFDTVDWAVAGQLYENLAKVLDGRPLDYIVVDHMEPDHAATLGQIAENRKCISKGGELDYSKAAALLIDEFRSGKLGQITLERPKIQDGSAE